MPTTDLHFTVLRLVLSMPALGEVCAQAQPKIAAAHLVCTQRRSLLMLGVQGPLKEHKDALVVTKTLQRCIITCDRLIACNRFKGFVSSIYRMSC